MCKIDLPTAVRPCIYGITLQDGYIEWGHRKKPYGYKCCAGDGSAL